MLNAKKIAMIVLPVLLILFAVMILIERKEVTPNVYHETVYGNIEVNFMDMTETLKAGIQYDTLEEIEEAPEDVFFLKINDTIINNSDSISQFQNLKRLDISNSEINDFSFIKKLRNLETLHISYSSSHDFSFIKKLPNKEILHYLEIAYCQNSDKTPITDISYLEEFTGLVYLGLGGNDIRDLAPISNMTVLETLFLYDNFNIETLEPLYHLNHLKTTIIPPTYHFTQEDIKQLGDPYTSDTIYYD